MHGLLKTEFGIGVTSSTYITYLPLNFYFLKKFEISLFTFDQTYYLFVFIKLSDRLLRGKQVLFVSINLKSSCQI